MAQLLNKKISLRPLAEKTKSDMSTEEAVV